MHPVTEQILDWAKRSAVASSKSILTVPDLLCGVYALRDEPALAPLLLRTLGQEPSWPDAVVKLHTAAEAMERTDRKFPLDTRVRDLVGTIHARDPELPPEQLLPALLSLTDPMVEGLKPKGSTPAPAEEEKVPITKRLEEMLSSSLQMATTLNQEVLGQEHAVAMLGDAWFQSQLATPEGPRGIFTFLGPPGVGKTMLAEQFARHMNEFMGGEGSTQVAFRRFDLAEYAGHQAHEQLFGVAAFYKESRPGTLTGFVEQHPIAVILLDEIEKAHPNTIQSLLAVLDKGEVEDKSLEKAVSFRQVWFVITTNLGQDLFSASNQAGVLSGTGVSSELLLDVLTGDKNPTPDGRPGERGLSPELVSRLAKGGLVVLNKLEIRHHLSLVKRAFALLSNSESASPEVSVADDVAFLMVLSLLPRIDARRVSARSVAWAVEVVREAWEACRADVTATGHGDLKVALRCGVEARAWLDTRLTRAPVRVLVIDDQDHVRARLAADAQRLGIEVLRASESEDHAEVLRRFPADLVLLDLCIDEPPDSPRIQTGSAILGSLRTSHTDLPVWLFAEHADQRVSFGAAADRIVRRGGARGFLPCSSELTNEVEVQDFLARFGDVVEDLRYERALRELQRAHKNVALRIAYRWEPEERTIVGEVVFAREEVVFDAADRRAAIHFTGVPDQRFADVVGLGRAKRRLSQIVAWLKNPGALSVLGATLPRGFLLAGPPGTGKTLLARALAGEAGLPFLALAASELQSKWVGESEERIRELFARAHEYAPAIVFIDEIDGIARSRSSSEHQHTYSVLNQLLTCMDGFKPGDRPVFVLAATNHPGDLDTAILRPGRFDEVVPVDLPNVEARRQFFELRLRKVKHEDELDLERLVAQTGGCSPAELDRIVREAIYAAVAAGRDTVSGRDLADASRLVRFGAESQDMRISEHELRATAYHEAGHAVVHMLLFPTRPIDWLTIVPNERGALGFLATRADEESHSTTVDSTQRQLAVLLAGREAERILGGNDAVSAGARSDLHQATRHAAAAVSEWGFDDVWGPVAHDALPAGKSSVDLDERVRAWLEIARQRAIHELTTHADLLHKVAATLQERESIDGEELKVVLGALLPT